MTRAGLARVAARAGAIALLAGSAPADAQPPRSDYAVYCSGCHLMSGAGKPGAVPDMRGMVAPMASVARGRAYLVRVPGAAHAPLSDRELADVLNWMARSFGGAGRSFRPFTAEEVGRHRERTLEHPMRERRAVLRALAQ
jgi:mono/diheme cytochrome c family protein